jgi:hypothetical protein
LIFFPFQLQALDHKGQNTNDSTELDKGREKITQDELQAIEREKVCIPFIYLQILEREKVYISLFNRQWVIY